MAQEAVTHAEDLKQTEDAILTRLLDLTENGAITWKPGIRSNYMGEEIIVVFNADYNGIQIEILPLAVKPRISRLEAVVNRFTVGFTQHGYKFLHTISRELLGGTEELHTDPISRLFEIAKRNIIKASTTHEFTDLSNPLTGEILEAITS